MATVTKKRRGNESANFEINVGDGKFISLTDPAGVQELDSKDKCFVVVTVLVLMDEYQENSNFGGVRVGPLNFPIQVKSSITARRWKNYLTTVLLRTYASSK